MPHFEVVPATALLTSMASDAKPGLNAEYYGSGNFDGTQHRPAELTYPSSGKRVGDIPVNIKPVFTRVDSQVDFHWWDGSPRADLNDDDFGARWTGYIKAPESGMYQIGGFGMNAFELYVDDKQIVRSNTIHEASYQYAAVPMDAGKLYKIQLDYHEYANDAGIQLVWSRPGTTKDGEAIAAATQADAVIMVLGLSPRLEGEEMKVPVEGFEGGDRVTIGIPQVQEDLLKKVVALGKPVVLVLLNGSAVAINWAKDNVPAIMEAWYPGEEGGTAIADVLFGDYNPGGRLPVTFYKSVDQLPSFTDYSMKEKTYRFFTGEPLFRFGHGLSYTTFAYSNLKAPDITIGQTLSVLIDVENTGNVAGEEVVQLYVEGNANDGPIRSLQGFSRVALRPKQRKTVEFKLKPEQIARVAVDGRRRLDAGRVSLTVGGLPITIRITGASKILD
jgi:beta-glucosidase